MRAFFILLLVYLPLDATAQSVVDFRAFDTVSNDSVSLKDFSGSNGVAILFTSNACAFDNYYTGRIKSLVEIYQGKIQFVLVNSNLEQDETVEKMKEATARTKIIVPYLADKDQAILSLFGAKKTPEVFLLKPVLGKFTVFYAGSLDDNPQVASDVKQSYLRDNIDRLLAGQKSAENIRAVGCSIRKK